MAKPDVEKVSLRMEVLWTDAENRVIQDIVRRIRKNSKITSTADYQINRLIELGKSTEEIEKILKDALNATYPEMFELYDEVSNWEYVRNKDLYEQVNAEFIPPEDNEWLIQLSEAVKKQTKDELVNLAQSYGFTVMIGNKRVFTPFAQYYQQYVDSAIMDVISGDFDYNTVIRRVVTQMTNSGLRSVDYASGWSNRTPVAVRRSILTGVSQITRQVNERNASILGTDYYEVDWHAAARPEHRVWQGKVYSYKELVDICGLGSVTGLCGANCYHDYYPFIPGISERLYSDKWLEEQNIKEAYTKTWKGKEYDAYGQTQKQRQMETAMRAQREKVDALKAADADAEEITLARAKYQAQLNEYSQFCKKMGLKEQRERIYYDMRGRIAPGTKYSSMSDKEMGKEKTYTKGLSKGSMLQRCQRANEINDNYTVRKSKWSGKVIVDDEKCKKERVVGRKLWSCDIMLSSKCQDRTIIHEDLHARSGSYLNPLTYIPYGKMEEASVEMLAREICSAENIPFAPNKNKNVDVLYKINAIANICENDLDFAVALFAKDIRRRHEWLSTKVEAYIKQNPKSEDELRRLLSDLKGSK